MEGIQVRSGVRADAARVAELSGQLGYPVSAGEVEARLEGSPDGSEGDLLVAVHDGAVVGFLEVERRRSVYAGGWAEISGLVVGEGSRGRGVGRALVAAACAWARGQGFRRLRVRTNVVRERSARFYEGEGFRLVKQQRVYDREL